MKAIRVVTFNIRHGLGTDGKVGLDRTAAVLSGAGGDLMGLQEVDKYTPRSRFRHQPGRLGSILQMHWAFGANVSWLPGMQYGNAVLSRRPLLNWQNHKLPGSDEQRGLLEAQTEMEGASLSFFCTHLGLSDEDRLAQARKTVEIITQSGRPGILACDLNAIPGSPEYRVLSGVLRDATEAAGGVNTYPSGSPTRQLDFIFLTAHWQVVTAGPIISEASDHLAVAADIILI